MCIRDRNNNLWISTELTYLDYIAQQAGGLSDQMFLQNHLQSNRDRNWFEVKWLLYNIYLNYTLSKKQTLSFNFFGG